LNTVRSIALELKLSVLAERFDAAPSIEHELEDFAAALQRTHIERWLSNCLTSAKTWLACRDCIALFCRSMLACCVDEVDRHIQDDINMLVMVVAPPALSLDAQEAKIVDQAFALLSAKGRQFFVRILSQNPRHVAEGARLYARIAVRHERWAAVAFQGV
jgi:hypothetical protein